MDSFSSTQPYNRNNNYSTIPYRIYGIVQHQPKTTKTLYYRSIDSPLPKPIIPYRFVPAMDHFQRNKPCRLAILYPKMLEITAIKRYNFQFDLPFFYSVFFSFSFVLSVALGEASESALLVSDPDRSL